MSVAKPCREVWSLNRKEEMRLIRDCVANYRFIAFDTEFPGCLRDTPQHASNDERFGDMRFSVDRTKVIQLGLTLFDKNGIIGGTWEINFCDFGETQDARNEKSIDFLKGNGVNLKKIREEGIGIEGFFSELSWILKQTRNITWVTFHGSYDIAYLLKGLTGGELPVTPPRFAKAVASCLGSVFDLKHMAGRIEGLGSHLGLERLADALGLNRVGTAHHAGSDSELTARVFAKMSKLCPDLHDYEGFVYGLGCYRIVSDRLKHRQQQIHLDLESDRLKHRQQQQQQQQFHMMTGFYYGPPPPLPPPPPFPMFVPRFPPFGGFVLGPSLCM